MKEILRPVFSYLSGIWRYRWSALVIAATICTIGWFYVATLPDVYDSSARVFVESNPGAARQDQDSAEQSLQRELEDYERRMIEADRELNDFKLRNLDFVSSKGEYEQQLKSAKDQHKEAQEMLALARTRLEELQGQTKGVEAENDEIKAQQHEQQLQQSLEAVVAPHEAQIREMEAQVDGLLLKYTDLHPDVTALRRTVKRLKADRDAARAAFLSGQSAVGDTEDFANPVYEEMRLRLSEAEAEVGGKEARVEDLGNKLVDLQRAVDQVLQLEDEQQQLTRDHETLAKNHASLLTRLEKARLTGEVDTSFGSVSFRTLDPPEASREPSGPNRVGMSSAVFGGGIAAGIGIAFLISMLRPVFGDRRQLSEAMGVPVLGSVNMIWTPQQKKKRRVVNLAFMIAIFGLVGSYALVLAVFSLRIDVMSCFPI